MKKLLGMNDATFKSHLTYQKRTISRIFNHLADFLNYPPKFKVGIIQDNLAKRKEWEPYYLYLSTLEFWRRNLEGLIKHLKREVGENISGGDKHGKFSPHFPN